MDSEAEDRRRETQETYERLKSKLLRLSNIRDEDEFLAAFADFRETSDNFSGTESYLLDDFSDDMKSELDDMRIALHRKYERLKHAKAMQNVSSTDLANFQRLKSELLRISNIQDDNEFETTYGKSALDIRVLPSVLREQLVDIKQKAGDRYRSIHQERTRAANEARFGVQFNRVNMAYTQLLNIQDNDEFYMAYELFMGTPEYNIESFGFPEEMKNNLVSMRRDANSRKSRIQREREDIADRERANFWDPVRKQSVNAIQGVFDSGEYKGDSMFQFFLLDDVRQAWQSGDEGFEFACTNPVDMITQEDISSPIADNRILIYFNSNKVECWDAYGVSAYVASQLANNQQPTHPTDRKEYTLSTIALLGYIHGILRESDAGPGVKRKYMQEVFQKYQNSTNAELIVLRVSQTFDNPTIAFKQMVCERKLWFEDDKTPTGLCSAQPLKDLINFERYQKDLRLNVSAAKATGLRLTRREARKRTVTGAELPDPNEQNPTYRRIN